MAGPLVDAATRSRSGLPTVEIVRIEYQVTPFRAERFATLYWPVVGRVMAYGAKGYSFTRTYDDPEHFTHESLWEDREDFQRYWLSREMQQARERILGLYEQPVLPSWATILERG